jgi:hypothetical protein
MIGGMPVAAVDRTDVERFMHDIASGKTAARAKTGKKRGLARVTGGRTAATRTVGLLGAIFAYAVRHRMRSDNPRMACSGSPTKSASGGFPMMSAPRSAPRCAMPGKRLIAVPQQSGRRHWRWRAFFCCRAGVPVKPRRCAGLKSISLAARRR